MTSMAVRGTIILLAAVALIGAVVALRIAQAQQTRTYEISVTQDKVLESDNSVTITVEVTTSLPFASTETRYLHIANETSGTGCAIITNAQCRNPASIGGNATDFDSPPSVSGSVEIATSTGTVNISFTPKSDNMVEGDEKLYLALCNTTVAANCTGNSLLDTASITIVGERVYVDNTANNNNTSTVALKGNLSATPAEDQPIAASFTTGSDSNGYRMNNVKLKFWTSPSETPGGAPAEPAGVSVRLFHDDGRTPGGPGTFYQ